ncbi:hypothetical protein [Saccharopolyspora sp. 5N708]
MADSQDAEVRPVRADHWRPTGSPAGVNPAGTERAGHPVAVT